ncbi:hypothetical protein JTB14_007743 [Gonioctena quinquepunctata]|nr:hypothetical protein JTB14_007743 [Gonioctena quinquepunctata]
MNHGKKLDVPAGQGVTAEHLNAETPSSSVAVDDEILADEVLEEAEAEEQEVETYSNEDSDKENNFCGRRLCACPIIKQNTTWAELPQNS